MRGTAARMMGPSVVGRLGRWRACPVMTLAFGRSRSALATRRSAISRLKVATSRRRRGVRPMGTWRRRSSAPSLAGNTWTRQRREHGPCAAI